MCERMSASISAEQKGQKIHVDVSHPPDSIQYDLPLALKTYVPPDWLAVQVEQGTIKKIPAHPGSLGTYVLYRAFPGAGQVRITKG